MTVATPPATALRRNRRALLTIFVLTLGALLAAGALRFSGWRPADHNNKGQLLQPYGDLRDYAPTRVDGNAYRWTDSPRTWRIVAAPRGCGDARREACTRLLKNLDTVWRILGRHAERVHVLWAGEPPVDVSSLREVHLVRPDAGLLAGLPGQVQAGQEGDPVWLVDPNGFVVMRYAPGFQPGDLRADLARLLRVN